MIPSKKKMPNDTAEKKDEIKSNFTHITYMLVGLRDSKKLENVGEKKKIIQKHKLCL